MSQGNLLIVEDDQAIGRGLVRVLESQGYAVTWLRSGLPVLAAAGHDVPLVILDLGLPDTDGIEVCRKLRISYPGIAIVILSARDQELDIVAGLDAGADDYLVKPFRLAELLARLRTHLRRVETADRAEHPREPVEAGDLRVDSASRQAWKGERKLNLRPKEFDLLNLLVSEAGRAVTRQRIMIEIWDTEWMGSTKTLDTHIHSLRREIGSERLTTLRGIGYRLDVE